MELAISASLAANSISMTTAIYYPYARALHYSDALGEQQSRSKKGELGWILFTPSSTISMGKRAHSSDLLLDLKTAPEKTLLITSDRGGQTTYHGPGQLVGFPFGSIQNHREVRSFFTSTMNRILNFLNSLNLPQTLFFIDESKGAVFKNKENTLSKVASFGIRIHKENGFYSFSHGFSLNLDSRCLDGFTWIVACGDTATKMDSIYSSALDDESFKTLAKKLGHFLTEKTDEIFLK